ncbi:hypothetical protein [Henriciella marina]|uniref:hypothetical protein n=1 Tax=Henriciella marina TaxID=453851 RepID=UPI0012E9BEB5|nr:hypothetical protein [Henriciella marina]
MPQTSHQLYRAHVKNLRAIETALTHTRLSMKQALSATNDATADVHLKTVLLLTGAWAECRLNKLVYEPGGLSEADRALVQSGTQYDQWLTVIKTGFQNRYINSARRNVEEPHVNADTRARYDRITSSVDTHLKPIIEMRNKLAHGQWVRALNAAGDDINPRMIQAIHAENALTSQFKAKLIDILADIVHDLVSGGDAFPRDYNAHYERYFQIQKKLETVDYDDWKRRMIEKYKRGKDQRRTPQIS